MVDIRNSSHNFLHAFCIRPKLSFETQSPDEEPILILRAHPITQLFWVINGIIFLIILIFANLVLNTFLSVSQIIFINIFFLILIGAYLYLNLLQYFFNVGIVTNKRVLDLDFHAVIYKELTETRLEKVEDVTVKSGGYFASLFNYGDVFIQTAGAEKNIEFLKVPRPTDVVTIINKIGHRENV